MVKRLCLFLFFALMVGSAVAQQTTGGQLWVRAFEDRNGNGVLDPGEPLLTRGVNVNLIDANGIIIATALLDDSPNAARGLVGFQFLPPGQYTVEVTSAEFTPTTPSSFTETVMESGVEAVHRFEYGAQRVSAATNAAQPAAAVTDRDSRITQIALAAGGAAVVMVLMVILGMMIFMFTLRTRLMAARAADARLTTGSMRRVTTSTGEYRKS